MIAPNIVVSVDQWLDGDVAIRYRNQPMAQDWARVAKVGEEIGEVINELILSTGQNPRKGYDDEAANRLLTELADTALTAVFAIQHFTKNVDQTAEVMRQAQIKIASRVPRKYRAMPQRGKRNA